MADTESIFEELIETAVEATMIVVESQLHGDPIPSLRSHYKRIVDARERLYGMYGYFRRLTVDSMLRERGVRALNQELRDDARLGSDGVYRTLLDLLFCEGDWSPTEPDAWALPDFNHMLLV